jgi:hypothetical protein
MRSNATILASYSFSRSAAWASSSKWPVSDQLAREIMPLGKPVEGLPGNKLLRHLALQLNAVRTLSGHASA